MPAPRQRPTNGRDAYYNASLARGSKDIAAHAGRLFPAVEVHALLAIVDRRYDEAVARGASPEILARLADAAIDLNEALRDGEYQAHRTAEGWSEVGYAILRADEAIQSLGELILDREEAHVVMSAAKKRAGWGKRG
jgi:hypothetical protein